MHALLLNISYDCVCAQVVVIMYCDLRGRIKENAEALHRVLHSSSREQSHIACTRFFIITPCALRRGRVIGLSRCLFVCLFVDTKTSTLIEVGQHMSSTSYV